MFELLHPEGTRCGPMLLFTAGESCVMKLELVPMLAEQRKLYDLPRGWERFRTYVNTMVGGSLDDVALPPMIAMNPMGKEHVAATYDALLALDAEAVAAEALAEAKQRLIAVPGQFRVGLTVADDVGGGWTNRYAAEMARFNGEQLRKRGWITVGFWTGEQPSVEKVRETVLLCVFRMAYAQQHGWPTTLRQMLAQESAAAAFAGVQQTLLDEDELAYTHGVLAPLLDTTDYATQFAALWGDEAAAQFGYQALGLSPYAGIALAIHEAHHQDATQEAGLVV